MLEQVYPSSIRRLKRLLPTSSWQWVIPALRMDALIWESLCNFEKVFGVSDLSQLIQQPDDCAPAALALKALKYPRTPQELRVLPLIPIEATFRESVEAAEYSSLQSLSDAALIALNLRQKRHSTGSWNDWTSILEDIPVTALACLFGIIPDQIEFLQALLPSRSEGDEDARGIQRLLRVILSNPAPQSVHIELITILSRSLSPREQELLHQTLFTLQPVLAKNLAIKPDLAQSAPNQKGRMTTAASILSQIKAFTEQFPISIKVFDPREPALKAQQLSQSIQWTAQAQALMLAKLAILSEMNSADTEADLHWQNALSLQPQSETLNAIVLIRSACTSQASQSKFTEECLLAAEPNSKLLTFISQCIYSPQGLPTFSQSENTLAVNAQKALAEIEALAATDPFLRDQEIYQYLLARLCQVFTEKGWYRLAQQAVSLLLRQKPNHPSLLALMAILLHAQGNHEPALNLLDLLEGFYSDDSRLKGLLAQSYAANREWEQALHLWQICSPSSAVHKDYEQVVCARFAGQITQAIELCNKKLESSPHDGILLSCLAEINQELPLTQRIEMHQQAIDLSPAEAYVWLAYARTAMRNNDIQKALDILNAADQTLPKNPFILSSLGEIYLEIGQPSLALPLLQAAADLVTGYKLLSSPLDLHDFLADETNLPPLLETIHLRFNEDWGSPLITFDQWYGNLNAKLGQALQLLGHRAQAHQILEKALEAYPANLELAHQLARLNILEGNYVTAGQLLKTILSKTNSPQAVVDFATCALEEPSLANLNEVILSLQSVLESQPDHFEALTLLAKAFGKTNHPQNALKLYDQILRFPQARQQPLREQLAFEMSQTALQAADYELALATLLECNPQNPLTQRALAETYFHLGLFQEAAQAAQKAHSLKGESLETLIWYACLLIQLAQADASHAYEFLSAAIEALHKAIEFAPHRSDLQLTLAEALYQVGDSMQAKEILLRFVPENDSEISKLAAETELQKAGRYLMLLGEQNAALSCYEQCLSLLQAATPSDSQKITEILQIIADIYRQNRRYPELEKTLKHAIDQRPDDLALFFDYLAAWLEVNLDPTQLPLDGQTLSEIDERFEHHLKQNAEAKEIFLLYGLILRWSGNSEKAIEILNQLFANLINDEESPSAASNSPLFLTCLTELSRIHRSRGEQQLADYWLEEGLKRVKANSTVAKNEIVEFMSDWLEAALGRGEDCQSLLLNCCNKNPDHLRLIALMSLVKMNQGDRQGAKLLFDTAITGVTEPSLPPFSFHPAIAKLLSLSHRLETLYTFANAAQRLGQWNLACELLNQAIRLEPEGRRAHWKRLIALVLRAEYQHICQRLGMVTNAPGPLALAEEAIRDFETSSQFLKQPSIPITEGQVAEIQPLSQWILRGQLAFSQAPDKNLEFSERKSSVETLIGYLLNSSEANRQEWLKAASTFQTHPLVQFCLALALLETQPQGAVSLLENLLAQLAQETTLPLPQQHWILSSQHFLALAGAAYAQAILKEHPSNSEEITQKRSQALQAIEVALEYYPEEVNWHLLAAELATLDSASQASLQKAIDHLEQALQWNTQSIEVYLKLAQLYLAIQKTDCAIQLLENASALGKDDAQVDYWLAKAYFQRHQYDIAAQFVQNAIDKAPLEIDYLLLRGEIALKVQDAATALQLAEQSLERPTENPQVWSLFARALHAAGKTDDALRVLEQTIPFEAEFLHLHLERVAILHQWQGPQAALLAINGLLEAFPQSAILLLREAEILAELGEVEEAIRAAQSALRYSHQISPSVTLENHAHSHRLLGELFYRSGHLDQAVYHLNEAITLLPNDASAHLILADSYLARGESERALAAYQRCLSLNPEDSQAYFKAGVLYKELKDYPNAEQMLRQAARLEPNNLAVQRQLGAVVALNLIHTQRTKEKNTP
ncbi:MAG: hypothetical protein DDG59_09600 [Anaerolineae bacterium]|nr:MAG: hypothetical protein DDG59_09600 [Anaerolineae bacterium]